MATVEHKRRNKKGDAAEEDRGAATGEEACTTGVVEEEVMGDCFITKRAVMKVF